MEFRTDQSGLTSLRIEAEGNAVEPLADAIFDDSQRFVPVLSGDLLRSGRIETVDHRTREVRYGDDLPDGRAVYQEAGTSKMDAQPYLRPAAYKVRDL
jgi:hypothetical protein